MSRPAVTKPKKGWWSVLRFAAFLTSLRRSGFGRHADVADPKVGDSCNSLPGFIKRGEVALPRRALQRGKTEAMARVTFDKRCTGCPAIRIDLNPDPDARLIDPGVLRFLRELATPVLWTCPSADRPHGCRLDAPYALHRDYHHRERTNGKHGGNLSSRLARDPGCVAAKRGYARRIHLGRRNRPLPKNGALAPWRLVATDRKARLGLNRRQCRGVRRRRGRRGTRRLGPFVRWASRGSRRRRCGGP
jgi:hypothetical protein